MKYESYALYMKAIVYHMNHLQQRKDIESGNNNRVLDEATNTRNELGVEGSAAVDLTADFNYSSFMKKCHSCSSTDVEFDNSIGRLVCMGCGEEKVWNIE